MPGIDSYMNKYLDRRMKYLIEEWDLSTRQDTQDFEHRLESLEEASHEIQDFETGAEAKLDELEARLKKLQEAKK
jgi:polyhydroxyalkanoate synthesis regulator phasin